MAKPGTWWNAAEPRLFTPKTYGWGFDLNPARLFGLARAKRYGV